MRVQEHLEGGRRILDASVALPTTTDFTSLADSMSLWLGAYDPDNVFLGSAKADVLQLAEIPEPSTLILLSMAALCITIGWWQRR
jgi:hypothetical protein